MNPKPQSAISAEGAEPSDTEKQLRATIKNLESSLSSMIRERDEWKSSHQNVSRQLKAVLAKELGAAHAAQMVLTIQRLQAERNRTRSALAAAMIELEGGNMSSEQQKRYFAPSGLTDLVHGYKVRARFDQPKEVKND